MSQNGVMQSSSTRKDSAGAIVKILLSIGALVVALVPSWFYFFLRYILGPKGFWQEFALFGVFGLILSCIQIFLLIFWIAFVISVISSD